MPAVPYTDLRGYLGLLEAAGLLQHITAEVDPKHELGAICARSLDRQGPALQFDNITSYAGKALVANLISTLDQVAIAFNTDADEGRIHERVVDGLKNRVPSEVVQSGPCKQVIHTGDDIDIYEFPSPVWHELDGGPFLGTTAGCITRDPQTGAHNMGAYRVMIKDRDTLTMNARGPHPVGSTVTGSSYGGPTDPGADAHILYNEASGRPTPIAIAMGMDPLLTLASGTGVPVDSQGYAEYEAAGGWRGSPTELVACETSDLLVPAHAEMIVEGEVVPGARAPEGPHGESTGFYGENPAAFVIKIRCITHRKDPLTYGLICRLIEDYPRFLLRSGTLQNRLIHATGMDNIKQVFFPEVGRNGMLIVSATIRSAAEPKRIMDAVWEHLRFRWVIVVDEDCNVRDWNDVMWRVCAAAVPDKDIIAGPLLSRQSREGAEVDFVPPPCGMGVDATMRFKETRFPPVNTVSKELMGRVAERWKDLGLAEKYKGGQ
jgi:4-hydroxy-3-polyprenylbenzoate decarboxylase